MDYMYVLIIQVVVGLAIAAALALIPANIAKSKGRSFGLWWLYGLILFTIATVHALVLPSDARVEEASRLASGGRKCPYCAEVVKGEAVVCRFCGRDLEPIETPALPGDVWDSRSTSESDMRPMSEDELDRYMIEAGYSGAQADDGTDYRVLALAELEIMPSDQRKKILGAMRSSTPHPNQDEELHPYAAWVRHGDAQRWASPWRICRHRRARFRTGLAPLTQSLPSIPRQSGSPSSTDSAAS